MLRFAPHETKTILDSTAFCYYNLEEDIAHNKNLGEDEKVRNSICFPLKLFISIFPSLCLKEVGKNWKLIFIKLT